MWLGGEFFGIPRVPRRLTADGVSGISCRIRLSRNSPSGKGGGAEGFGIGGAYGTGLVNPSVLGAGGLKHAGASGSNPG